MCKVTIRSRRWAHALVAASAMAVVAHAAPAAADAWNDKTELKFSAPIAVPGATLQPGTYVFKLLDSASQRHVVQVWNDDETNLIVTTHAIPTRRDDAKGDVVLTFNPGTAGAPPALKAWYYPGSIYGHEFVYSDEQAREIAQRSRTIVLSGDVPEDSDFEGKGRLYTYDAQGMKTPWRGDAATLQEYERWRQSRDATQGNSPAVGAMRGTPGAMQSEATAPMVDASLKGMPVPLAELEENPTRYIGKIIRVDAEVEEVLGPRLFTMDEQQWADLDGEILVHVPAPLAALVRDDDRISVTGRMQAFAEIDIDREWGWFGDDPEIEASIDTRPVLVASQIVGGNNDVALVIDASRPWSGGAASRQAGGRPAEAGASERTEQARSGSRSGEQALPTGSTARDDVRESVSRDASRRSAGGDASASGRGSAAPITDGMMVANATRDMIGRTVDMDNLRVEKVSREGFYVRTGSGDETVYVLPANEGERTVSRGDTVSIEGVLLQVPRHMSDRLETEGGADGRMYIFATDIVG